MTKSHSEMIETIETEEKIGVTEIKAETTTMTVDLITEETIAAIEMASKNERKKNLTSIQSPTSGNST